MTLILSHESVNTIQKHLESAYPEEGCGILGGTGSETKNAAAVHVIENNRRDSRQTRYVIAPEDFKAAEKSFKERGLQIVGFFHSHPDVAARPSQYDQDHAWPWYSYVIVSVQKGKSVDMKSWVLKEDRSVFDPEEIAVRGGQ